MITNKQRDKAIETLFRWFEQENNKNPIKPVTMLDTTIHQDDTQMRLITHMSFYGRDEKVTYLKEVQDE